MADEPILFVKLGIPVEDDDSDLPRQRYGYDGTFTAQQLRDSARAWWVVNIARARECDYLAAVHDGVVLGVWVVVPGTWRSIDGRRFGKSPVRWGCDVCEAPTDLRHRLVGGPVPDHRDGRPLFGRGSVIAYWP